VAVADRLTAVLQRAALAEQVAEQHALWEEVETATLARYKTLAANHQAAYAAATAALAELADQAVGIHHHVDQFVRDPRRPPKLGVDGTPQTPDRRGGCRHRRHPRPPRRAHRPTHPRPTAPTARPHPGQHPAPQKGNKMTDTHKRRTPITEDVTGRVGDTPATPTPEALAAMDERDAKDVATAFWQATLPPVGPAPTTQPTRTLSDLLDG